MIPKKIHYCWIGGNPLPKSAKKCIASWKKYCPDYEIIEWNETNYDFTKNQYMLKQKSGDLFRILHGWILSISTEVFI